MTFLVTIRLDISLFERWRRTWSSSSGSRKRRSCGEDITVGVSEGKKKRLEGRRWQRRNGGVNGAKEQIERNEQNKEVKEVVRLGGWRELLVYIYVGHEDTK